MDKKYGLLILDYGGVYSFDYDTSCINAIMLKVFGREAVGAEVAAISEFSYSLGCNSISVTDYISGVSEILGTAPVPSVELFCSTTIATAFPPVPEMVQLVKTVRAQGIKVSLLSDMYMFELEASRPLGRYEGFDHTSFSAEIGFTKSSPEAFLKTLAHFGVEPGAALFVDDIERHVETARSLEVEGLWVDKVKYGQAEELCREIYGRLGIGR